MSDYKGKTCETIVGKLIRYQIVTTVFDIMLSLIDEDTEYTMKQQLD